MTEAAVKSFRERLNAVMIYERRSRRLVREPVLGDRLLRLAYTSPLRPLCRPLLFGNGLVSRLLGWYCDSPLSRRAIPRTIAALAIDVDESPEPVESYRTFNQFFTRRLRPGTRPFDAAPEVLCCPADCRLTVYPRLQEGTCMPVKGAPFTMPELLQAGPGGCAMFANGAVAVARLCPADCHRYHFPAAGRVLRTWQIGGRLDSVNPVVLGLRIKVFTQNRRVVSLLDLERFGETAYVEVGAFGVSGIVPTHKVAKFPKMAEKGYFQFGGSTIVLVFQPGRVQLDDDLVKNSRTGYETRVLAGERIGVCAG